VNWHALQRIKLQAAIWRAGTIDSDRIMPLLARWGKERVIVMSNLYWKELYPGIFRRLLLLLFVPVFMITTGCGSGDSGGEVINELSLPTGTTLDLYCANEGIYLDDCVLDNPNNPFATIAIIEFDVNDPDAENKFELANAIPPGPEYAISRFYFWATALAKRTSGENQYFTAVALHELYTAGVNQGFGSPNAQNQAIRAYRSVLDNFFGSVTFFSTCDFLNPSPPEPELFYSVIVSDMTGGNLVAPDPNPPSITLCDGTVIQQNPLVTLFPSDSPVVSDFTARQTLGEWGFTWDEANELVFVNGI